jgi:hypothetical protein
LTVPPKVPAAGPLVNPQRVVTFILIVAPVLLLVPVLVPIAAAFGYQSLWASQDVTLTQAARAGDSTTVFRMLKAGANPRIKEALEAAVESRQVETVRLMIERAAPLSESDREELACLAVAAVAPEVTAYLQSSFPPATQPDCATRR